MNFTVTRKLITPLNPKQEMYGEEQINYMHLTLDLFFTVADYGLNILST